MVYEDVAETVMAVGGAPTKNGSSTSPEAEGEAYTTFGYEEGKCLVSYGPGGMTICAWGPPVVASRHWCLGSVHI